jgi:hypothetical protein
MKTFREWVPAAQPQSAENQSLPGHAGRVLSLIDGHASIEQLSAQAGIDPDDMLTVVAWLVSRGAVPTEGLPPEVVQLAQVHAHVASRGARSARSKPPASGAPIELVADVDPQEEDLSDLPELDPVLDAAEPYEAIDEVDAGSYLNGQSQIPMDEAPWLDPVLDAVPEDGLGGEEEAPWLAPVLDAVEPVLDDVPSYDAFGEEGRGDQGRESDIETVEPDRDEATANLRKLFETSLHPLPRDARIEWARTAGGEVLQALCLDPEPGVVQAVLENPNANLIHARLIAEHHRTAFGLDVIGRRSEFVWDATVRRFLLRNAQTSERLLARMLSPLTLSQIFRANMGHDLTERARKAARVTLREKFDRAPSEEKVAVIVQTEGRCLPMLPGQTFDQKTTALLCRKTYQSTMLIQSIARFPAAPPVLLTHLLKQQIVQRNAHLKRQIQQHKNCPKYQSR